MKRWLLSRKEKRNGTNYQQLAKNTANLLSCISCCCLFVCFFFRVGLLVTRFNSWAVNLLSCLCLSIVTVYLFVWLFHKTSFYNMEIRSLQGGLVYYLIPLPFFVMTGCRINKKSANTAAFHGCLSIETFRERQEADERWAVVFAGYLTRSRRIRKNDMEPRSCMLWRRS